MNKLPNPFWAFLFSCLGVVLIESALMHRSDANVTTAVISAGASLIAGAFGYISGHATGAASVPTPPANPAQPK